MNTGKKIIPVPLPNPPKLHLNEHLSPRLAVQLNKYGFDVTTSQGSEMLSWNDSEQLAMAVSEQRAIVTFNFNDFVFLHKKYIAKGKEHWGIVLSTEEPIGVLLHRLLWLLNSVSADKLKNRNRSPLRHKDTKKIRGQKAVINKQKITILFIQYSAIAPGFLLTAL